MTATFEEYDLFGNETLKHQACCAVCPGMFAENGTKDRLLNVRFQGAQIVDEPCRLPPLADLERPERELPDDIAEVLGLPDMIRTAKEGR